MTEKFRKYYCLFRRTGEKIPSTMTLEANDPSDAIAEMCNRLGVFSTTSIAEFEILEVLGDNKYAPAAQKFATGTPATNRMSKAKALTVVPDVTPVPSKSAEETKPASERVYTHYQTKAA